MTLGYLRLSLLVRAPSSRGSLAHCAQLLQRFAFSIIAGKVLLRFVYSYTININSCIPPWYEEQRVGPRLRVIFVFLQSQQQFSVRRPTQKCPP